jgi:hypothetical protein
MFLKYKTAYDHLDVKGGQGIYIIYRKVFYIRLPKHLHNLRSAAYSGSKFHLNMFET